MNRSAIAGLIALLLICILAHGVWAQDTNARIFVGSREAVCSPSAVYDGKRVLAPLSILEPLGCSCAILNGRAVAITSSAGRTGDVALVEIDGQQMLPLDDAMKVIEGEVAWDPEKHAATLYAHLNSVEFVENTLKINCSFPVTCKLGKWSNKLTVDVEGTRLASEAKEVYIGGTIADKARLGQYSPDVTRVVIDLVKDSGIALESRQPSAQLVFSIGTEIKSPDNGQDAKSSGDKTPGGPCTVNAIRFERIDDTRLNMIVETSAKPVVKTAFGVKPPEVDLILKGATLSQTFQTPNDPHPLIKGIKVEQTRQGVLVELRATRIVIFSHTASPNSVTLSVSLPDKAGGTLDGKTVVVDPGHGGKQVGAPWGDLHEKNLNLQIAKEVAAALEAEGAKVILTREGDQALGLPERPGVAIKNEADFFVSLHCNSNYFPNKCSGIETYYHMTEPSPMALGYAIQAAVCAATGMKDGSARSDGRNSSKGLAVLRGLSGSGIPGVLLECGYINTDSDRAKLLDPTYRKKVARGVVEGLKAYIEGTPIR